MAIDIVVPEVGESVTGGEIVTWFKENGSTVNPGDPLFELETDKITLTVPAEQGGVLVIKAGVGEEVTVGQVVATLDASGAAAPAPETPKAEVPKEAPKEEKSAPPAAAAPSHGSARSNELPDGSVHPSAQRLASQENVDLNHVQGTGKGGRILKEDVINTIKNPRPAAPAPSATVAKTSVEAGERQTRQRMSPIRRKIAARLVEAQQTAAILTTFNEADMTNIMALRKKYQDNFVKKYGIKLGFMSFFVKAVVDALQSIPEINAYIDGDDIVYNHFYDIGIAVGTDRGLVVPVIRNAEQLNFAEVELEIGNLAKKAREKRLTLDDMTGGSFSITNGGIYGSLLSTPILNPPQSGILGMHGIKKRPIAVGDHVEIRPMMYLALSYDHRIVDGAGAVTFLKRICECIENPERILLDV